MDSRPGTIPKQEEGARTRGGAFPHHRDSETGGKDAPLETGGANGQAPAHQSPSPSRSAHDLQARALKAERRVRELEAKLAESDDLVSKMRVGLRSYKNQIELDLATYKSQRAWKVMLAVRKAYGRWVQKGLKAKFAALIGLALAPFRPDDSEDEELRFPAIEKYVPLGSLDQPEVQRMESLPHQRKYDLFILSIIDFEFRFQRPQQIAVEYARRGHRVFWISANHFLPPDSGHPFRLNKLADNLWDVELRGEAVDLYHHELKPTLQESLKVALAELLKYSCSSEIVVLVQLPFWRRLALDLKAITGGIVAYDCMDDWDSFNNLGQFNRDEEKSLVEEADLLVVTAKKLSEKFDRPGLCPVLVRNGVDFDLFSNAVACRPEWPPGRPVIGYFGAIADWIDLDLIHEVARMRPNYAFVLIGQVFGRDVSKLRALDNVYLLGHQPYERIPQFLRLFDVCHIPFLLNEVTAATDPVKLYEYLSLGRPVVATDMPELRIYGDLVDIGRDASDYAGKLDLALAEDCEERRRRRIEFARANTWRARVDAMDSAIAAKFPRISIVIVTHNSGRFIAPCLDSIWANTSYPNYDTIVVDNASQDGAIELLERDSAYPNLQCVRLDTNFGFAHANNAGAQRSRGEYLVFLNADTVVSPGWLGRLLQHLQQNTAIGLICPVTNFAGNEAKVQSDYRDACEMERFAVDLARKRRGLWAEIPMVPLYCAMMAASLYTELGGMDERYEIGMFEDDDLSTAVRSCGLVTAMAEDCFVHHFGQGSFAKLPPHEYARIFEQNRRKYEEKWSLKWKPHSLRPGVTAPLEDIRFQPETFCPGNGAFESQVGAAVSPGYERAIGM